MTFSWADMVGVLIGERIGERINVCCMKISLNSNGNTLDGSNIGQKGANW